MNRDIKIAYIKTATDHLDQMAHSRSKHAETAKASLAELKVVLNDELNRSSADRVELACEVMHDAYEQAAVEAKWETNPQSRKPWADVPEANKQTMRAAVTALLVWMGETNG